MGFSLLCSEREALCRKISTPVLESLKAWF